MPDRNPTVANFLFFALLLCLPQDDINLLRPIIRVAIFFFLLFSFALATGLTLLFYAHSSGLPFSLLCSSSMLATRLTLIFYASLSGLSFSLLCSSSLPLPQE